MLAWVVVGEEEVDCVSVGVVGLRSSARDDVACRNGVGIRTRRIFANTRIFANFAIQLFLQE